MLRSKKKGSDNASLPLFIDDGEKDSKIRKQAARTRSWNVAFLFIIALFLFVFVDTEVIEGEEEPTETHKKLVKDLKKRAHHLKKEVRKLPEKLLKPQKISTKSVSEVVAVKEEGGNVGVNEETNNDNPNNTNMLFPPHSLYSVEGVKDNQGGSISFSKYGGMILLIVNVASKGDKTKETYEQLIQLQEKHREQGFTVLAFPSNDFNEEFETDEEISANLKEHFPKLNFPVFGISSLKTNPVYEKIGQQLPPENGYGVKSDFYKFLIDRKGNAVAFFDLDKLPLDDIQTDLEKLIVEQPFEKVHKLVTQ